MPLHVLPSATVLSDFRVARLLERLSPSAPGLKGLTVQDFFLVDGEAPQTLAMSVAFEDQGETVPTRGTM